MKNPRQQNPSSDITVREAATGTSGATPAQNAAPDSEATLIESPEATTSAPVPLTSGFEIDGWRLREAIKVTSGEADLWIADGKQASQTAVIKVFRWGLHPKPELQAKLSKVSRAQVVEVYGQGVLPDGRHFEILEHIRHGTLADSGKAAMTPARVKAVLKELADAVEALHEAGILHRDLKPSNVLVRTMEPLDLVLTDFGISSLAELSLHATSAHRTAAYSAPEAMTGVVSRASDWWSVGVMVLELLRGAHPFAGLDERAVNFQLVTRGIEVPTDLPSDWALLVKGLLTRDHAKRWGAEQVQAWLEGKRNLTVHYTAAAAAVLGQKPYRFRGCEYGDAAALAAALAEKWEEGVKHWARGYVLQWVEKQLEDQDLAVQLHDVQDDAGLKIPELQLAAAALAMNRELPMTYKGELVTPDWLGGKWDLGREVLESGLPRWLNQLRKDDWLEQAMKRCLEGMRYVSMVSIPVDTESAWRLLASNNRTVVDDLVAERRRKYAIGRKKNLTVLLRKDALEFHEAVILATADENEFCTPEQVLVEESLAWLDKQGVKYDREKAIQLIMARNWEVLTPTWEARRQRFCLAKSPVLEKALASTAPDYLEAVLGVTAEEGAFWPDACAKGEAYATGDGVARNMDEAARWYRLAAEQGHPDAQFLLESCYAKGPKLRQPRRTSSIERLAQGSPNRQHLHAFPKLHNAMWPGLVGKGSPGAEPCLDLDIMLNLTAAAEVDGVKFDGVDIFLYEPHIPIDANDDELKRIAEKIQSKGLMVGSVVAPIWAGTGGGSAMGDVEERKKFVGQVRKACRITSRFREWGLRSYGVIRIDSACSVDDWAKDPAGNTKRIAITFREACDVAGSYGERLAAEGEICWGGMHSWKEMIRLLESVNRPKTLGFQADMAHTLLYTLGYNAPEAALLPPDWDWSDPAQLDNALKILTAALRPWTIDLHIAQNDATVKGSGDHDKTGRHCLADDPHGKLEIARHAGYWLRDQKGDLTKAVQHVCWDGCMFPNEVMMKPETWNTILASMLAVRDAHGWTEERAQAVLPAPVVETSKA